MNKLNFGCGTVIKKGYINVDIQKGKGIEKSFDFNKFPYPFEDNTFDYILADNVIEHLKYTKNTMLELHRISNNNATIEIKVPHQTSVWSYADMSHRHYFNEKSILDLFSDRSYIINKKLLFSNISMKLKPAVPFKYVPKIILKVLSRYLLNIYCQIEIKSQVIKSEIVTDSRGEQ